MKSFSKNKNNGTGRQREKQGKAWTWQEIRILAVFFYLMGKNIKIMSRITIFTAPQGNS